MNDLCDRTARSLRHWGLAAVVLSFIVYLANVLLGPLNQDEGWYLYAAQLVSEGAVPYRDFFYTQGIVMPYVYAAFEWAWAPFGILGGRLFTALLSLLAILLATRTLDRVMGSSTSDRLCARLLLWSFLGLNLWYTYFTAIPKAYALCTLGIALALYLLAVCDSKTRGPLCAATAGGLLALVAGIRLSMGILLPVVGIWLLLHRKQVAPRAWLFFGLGGLLVGALAFSGPILLWNEGFLAAQRFHAARDAMGMLGILGCIARWIRFNPVLILALVALVLFRPKSTSCMHLQAKLWLLCGGALCLVHLVAPVPYDDYAIPALLPLAMAAATLLPTLPLGDLQPRLIKTFALLSLLVTTIGAPLAQEWFVIRQDRFWVETKSEPDLFRLRRAGVAIRAEAERLGTDTLWTQDTYLAVEAGLKVPAGLEMGPFSPPQALEQLPPLAAWSGYTFAMEFPSLVRADDQEERLAELKNTYDTPLLVLPNFGQGHTTLTLAERSMP